MHPGAAAPAPPGDKAAQGAAVQCPDCGTAKEPEAQFCGVCRYDFTNRRSYSPPTPPLDPQAAARPPAAVAATPSQPQPQPAGPSPQAPAGPSPPWEPDGSWYVMIDFEPALDPTIPAGSMAPRPRLTFPLDLQKMLVGRSNTKHHPEIPVDDEGVSGRHAQVEFTPSGPTLTDIGSTNGTVVDGAEATPGLPVRLKDGSIATIGRWTRITVKHR
jgi:hypothetical protein